MGDLDTSKTSGYFGDAFRYFRGISRHFEVLLDTFLINLGGDFIGELDAGEVVGYQIRRVSILVHSTHQELVAKIDSVKHVVCARIS